MLVANVLSVVWPNGAAGISILPLSSGLALLLLIGQIAFYGAAYLGWILEQQGKQIKLLNVIYYFVSSNLAALVGFWRWLRRTQRVTWQKRSLTVSEKMTAGDQGITQGITHEPRP
jgi:poly-beta-1,6-N-acetyl-D-glucosamine synthase